MALNFSERVDSYRKTRTRTLPSSVWDLPTVRHAMNSLGAHLRRAESSRRNITSTVGALEIIEHRMPSVPPEQFMADTFGCGPQKKAVVGRTVINVIPQCTNPYSIRIEVVDPLSILAAHRSSDMPDLAMIGELPLSEIPSRLRELTAQLKAQPQNKALASEREELAVAYLWAKVDNKEVAAVVEKYITDRNEKTDIQTLILGGKFTDRVIAVLQEISLVASQSLAGSLLNSPECQRLVGTMLEAEALTTTMKESSPFYPAEEAALMRGPHYWDAESKWIEQRKKHTIAGRHVWQKDDRENAALALAEAKRLEPRLAVFIDEVIRESGLGEDRVLTSSVRTKGLDSLLKKLSRFKETDWGKNATIADVVDLSGGRIVVDNLEALERIMVTVEKKLNLRPSNGEVSGFNGRILRKENKFIGNEGRDDPYRAIQYTITFEGEDGKQFTFELQLKTFSGMIASDLYHNTVYKPHVLGLPAELNEVVKAYNWGSLLREFLSYLGKAASEIKLTDSERVEQAIEQQDYNTFYDLVLRHINPNEPLSEPVCLLLSRFHAEETDKLRRVHDKNPEVVLALAAAAHDSYYADCVQGGVENPDKVGPSLGWRLPPEAVALLTPAGQSVYNARFENFRGRGGDNKISAEALELHLLDNIALERFFAAAGKNVDAAGVQKVIKQIKNPETRQGITILNLFHTSFKRMQAQTAKIKNPDARRRWKKCLLDNQIGAIASATILTEIGGEGRDLSLPAFAGSTHTMREMLTFLFFISAINPGSEFRASSYYDFISHPNSAWAVHIDEIIDKAILKALAIVHLRTINERITGTANPIASARLQTARAEIMVKYVKAVIANSYLANQLVAYLEGKYDIQQEVLLRGNGGASELNEYLKTIASLDSVERQADNTILQKGWEMESLTADQRKIVDLLVPIIENGDLTLEDISCLREMIAASDAG